MSFAYRTAFKNILELKPHDSESLILFALSIRYNIDDLRTLAAECLTGGSEDKKIDAVFIDEDELGCAVLIQGYMSAAERDNDEAPANKANDLNTAVTWAFNQPLDTIPLHMRSNIAALRDGIRNGKIRKIEFWYVHNLKESMNVTTALQAVERSANVALATNFEGCEVMISALEVGNNILEEWYSGLSNPIIVNESYPLDSSDGYEVKGDKWNSYVTKVPAMWLNDIFKRHGMKLFSANIRGYLGSRKSDSNINNRIKETCEKEPKNFWVYNNGITCLVNSYKKVDNKLEIEGISILNGAQTTGAIASSQADDLSKAYVPARFVMCSDNDTLESIIRYNNSQNSITAADFRSNDTVQRRLRIEFDTIPNAKYKGRRGGAEDIIRRAQNLVPSDTVAQALATMHGNPILAYNSKADIWEDNNHYSKYFNEQTTARHVVFAYSLLRALEKKKKTFKESERTLTQSQKEQLEILRTRGAIILLANAISECLETILSRQIANKARLSFGVVSPDTAISIWEPIVSVTIPFCKQLKPALDGGLNNQERARNAVSTFKSLVESSASANKVIFEEFSARVNET